MGIKNASPRRLRATPLQIWRGAGGEAFIIILILYQILFAISGDAGREVAVLDVGNGARAMALGSAFTAHNPDVSSLYWNPAGLGFIEKYEIATMQSMLSSEAKYYYLGGLCPLNYGVIGFSWAQIQLPDISNTAATLNSENEVDVIGILNYYENAEIIGYGNKLTDNLSFGLNIKSISKKISDDYGEGKGTAASMGILYLLNDDASLGIVADNLANTQIYDTGTVEHSPARYICGFLFGRNSLLSISLDCEKSSNRNANDKGRIGFEYKFNKNMNLRLGYNYDRLTAGAGFNLQNLYADYAYIAGTSYNLGSEQFVTLGVRW